MEKQSSVAWETIERLRALLALVKEGNSFCPQCGIIPIDEDGCCQVCGATADGHALQVLHADIQLLMGQRDRYRETLQRIAADGVDHLACQCARQSLNP